MFQKETRASLKRLSLTYFRTIFMLLWLTDTHWIYKNLYFHSNAQIRKVITNMFRNLFATLDSNCYTNSLLCKWIVKEKKLPSEFWILLYEIRSAKGNKIWSHQFMGNRWGNSGNSVRLYFGGLQNHCRWWLQKWN